MTDYLYCKYVDFHMEEKYEEEALKAVKEAARKLGPGLDTGIIGAITLDYAMKLWKWDPVYEIANESGDIIDLEFCGESYGYYSHLFEALAPFVDEGSSIEMYDGVGDYFRYYFTGGHCYVQEGIVTYPDAPGYSGFHDPEA